MRAAFKSINVRDTTMDLIGHSQNVVKEYKAQGLRLTLRQLYYQLVTKNIIPNEEKSYKRLGKAISTGRLCGLLDWDAIEDRGRVPKRHPEWSSIKDIVESALRSYRLPRLEGQENYVELWVEKEALAGVLEPIANRYHVVLMVNKGYSSQSAMYRAACRIDKRCRSEKLRGEGNIISHPTILYLGDFDPSGEDMVRDISDRLNMFLRGYSIDHDEDRYDTPYETASPTGWNVEYCGAVQVEVEKIAITKEQIAEYNPPPNPAKLSDSRAKAFIAEHGASSWEVDALPPKVLEQIVSDALYEKLDMELMQRIIDKEAEHRTVLRDVVTDIMEDES